MLKAILKITAKCNNDCVFCHSKPKRKILRSSAPNHLRKLLVLKKLGIKTVYLSGGEPLVAFDFWKIIQLLDNIGMTFGLISNGRLLSDYSLMAKLRSKGLMYIHTTLLGPSELLHDSLTNVSGSFSQTIQAIQNALLCGVEIDVNCVVLEQNLHSLQAIINLVRNLGLKKIKFSFVEPIDGNGNYVPHISAAAKAVINLIMANKNSMQVVFDGFPLCLITEVNYRRENLLTKNVRFISEFYEDAIYFSDYGNKVKTRRCISCERKNECEGIFEKYIQIFGDRELIPLR